MERPNLPAVSRHVRWPLRNWRRVRHPNQPASPPRPTEAASRTIAHVSGISALSARRGAGRSLPARLRKMARAIACDRVVPRFPRTATADRVCGATTAAVRPPQVLPVCSSTSPWPNHPGFSCTVQPRS